MGGAQPLAVTMNEGVAICVEVEEARIDRRIKEKYLNVKAENIEHAIELAEDARERAVPLSIGLLGNCAEILPRLLELNFKPDVVTDQTSAHDMLHGYVPDRMSFSEAQSLRQDSPDDYIQKSKQTVVKHVEAMLEFQRRGSITFDYGNNIRGEAQAQGVENAFDIPGFVPEYIRPLFCEGSGPFRWVALSGDPEDIYRTDRAVLEAFPENEALKRWITKAQKKVKFQGLPSRICWFKFGEREKFALVLNDLVRKGEVSAPIVIGRDHLDCGSVASPNRETEGMLDGSDAVADWPLLNGLINAVNGATWVSYHHGGGVGMGKSIHAGMVIVADGTDAADKRLSRVLRSDPQMGVIRHADAGYQEAKDEAKSSGIQIPMGEE